MNTTTAVDRAESRAALMTIAISMLVTAALIWKTGFSFNEMDWNCDGHISLHEILEAVDVQRVNVGMGCREYFDSRNGSLVRANCPAPVCLAKSMQIVSDDR